MVKNLSTIDRGTKLRFGRWHNDDQAENTIVINASDTPINASNANALYMKPIRSDPSNNTIMTGFDPNSFEILDTGLRRDDVAPREVDYYANIGNTFTSTIKFEGVTSLTTEGVVGIANVQPIHTLDVGTKFFVDENGANVLTVMGDTYVQDDVVIGGNLDVRGTLTTIDTENTTIKDAIVEIGKGNTLSDVGFIMNRPGSNVAIGYRDSVDEFVIAHTDSSANSTTIVPSGELIDVRVHGHLHTNSSLSVDTNLLHVDAISDRVGINTLFPQSTLDVIGDAKIASNLAVGADGLYVDTVNSRVGINTTLPTTDFQVQGEALVSGNLNVTHDITVTENIYVSNNLTVTKDTTVEGEVFAKTDLTVTENAYVSNNLTVTKDVTVTENAYVSNNLTVTKDVTVNGEVFANTDLTVNENVYVSNNLTVTKDVTVNGDVFAKTDLTITENAYVSNNLTVTKDVTVNGNVFARTDLTVTENAYVSNNLTVTKDVTVNGDVFAKTDLIVTENAFVSNNLTITKDLTTEGNIFVNTDLTVTENVYVSNNLTITKDLTTEGEIFAKTDLTVTENAFVSNNLTVTEDLTTEGEIFAKTDLTVTENVFVSNNLTVTKDITVTENAYVSNNLTVTKNVIISGDTPTTSKTTGALTVVGGIGVHGNVHATHVNFEDAEIDSITVTDTTASTSVTTGAAKITGGLGVSGNVYGSNVIAAGDSYGKFTGPFLSKNDATTEGEAFMENLNAGEMTTQSISVVQDGVSGTISNPIIIDYYVSNWLVNNQSWNDVFHFTFVEGFTYVFDISDPSSRVQASGPHIGYFGITGDFNYGYNSTPYEFGVKHIGEQGYPGAQFRWTVPRGASSFQGGGGGSHPGPGYFYFMSKPITTGTTYPGNVTERRIRVIPNPDDHLLTGQTHVHGLLNAESVNVTDTTSSTSTTTGAVKIAGGLGVVGNVYADTFYGDGSNLTGDFSMTSIVTTSDVNIGNNISIAALTENTIPYVGADKYLADSYITQSTNAILISSNLEIRGNVTVVGNSFAIVSNSFVVKDRIIGIANNNSSHLLDVGIVMQHPGKNIGLIHHGAATENDPHDHTFTIGYTQNTLTDNHILDDSNLITVEILGNLVTQNNLTVSHDAIISGSTPSSSKTTGALQVAGGVGIIGDVFAESGDFTSLVTTSNVATTNLTASDTIHTTNLNISDTVTTTNISTVNITSSDTIHTTNVATINVTASDTIHTTNVATINVTASDTIHTTNVATINVTASDTIHTTNVATINVTASDTIHTTNVATINLTASDTIHTTNVATINLTASDTLHTTNVATTNVTASDTIHTTNVVTTNLTASDTIHTTNLNITDTITTTNVVTTNVTASDTIHTANLVASDTVKVTNGLITNLGGLTRKTYSYSSGTITASTTPEINVVFANQMFSAKITAHLVEPTSNISVLNLDVTGGTGRDIGKGFLSITGDENSKHWNSTIATTDTTVTLTPSVGLISNGTYGIHVEHTSPLGVGGVTSIDKDNTVETTFNY